MPADLSERHNEFWEQHTLVRGGKREQILARFKLGEGKLIKLIAACRHTLLGLP